MHEVRDQRRNKVDGCANYHVYFVDLV